MGRILLRGSTGTDVKELQAALNFHVRTPAVALKPDGIFGPLTEARVRDFQRRAGITVDAKVGPDTIAALYRTVFGIIDIDVTPQAKGVRGRAFAFGPGGGRLRVGEDPDFIPPSKRVTQVRTAESAGFETESKFFFNPLADPNDGEHSIRLTLSPNLPWPVFQTLPLELDVELTNPAVGKFQIEGKIKRKFELIKTRRFELNPYFFVGAGVNQDHFKELNAGGGANVRVKVFENIFGSGVSLSVEADGGAKANWDKLTGEGKFKFFAEGGFLFEKRFNLF